MVLDQRVAGRMKLAQRQTRTTFDVAQGLWSGRSKARIVNSEMRDVVTRARRAKMYVGCTKMEGTATIERAQVRVGGRASKAGVVLGFGYC